MPKIQSKGPANGSFAGDGGLHWSQGEAGRYLYDENGNMVYRQTAGAAYVQTFGTENRLVEVYELLGDSTTTFAYDAAGRAD